jgi:hypothetical protein
MELDYHALPNGGQNALLQFETNKICQTCFFFTLFANVVET